AGSADRTPSRTRGTRRDAQRAQPAGRAAVAVHFERRRLSLHALTAGAILTLVPFESLRAQAASAVRSVRMWPSEEYTRLTIESSRPLKHSLMTLSGPDPVVVDIEGAELANL